MVGLQHLASLMMVLACAHLPAYASSLKWYVRQGFGQPLSWLMAMVAF